MNYDQPRQTIDGTGWHYTTGNRRLGIRPLGYCRTHEPHPTEEEARECYARYLRDHMKMRAECTNWGNCTMPNCRKPARNLAEAGEWLSARLCNSHFTHDNAIIALGLDHPAGDLWHS